MCLCVALASDRGAYYLQHTELAEVNGWCVQYKSAQADARLPFTPCNVGGIRILGPCYVVLGKPAEFVSVLLLTATKIRATAYIIVSTCDERVDHPMYMQVSALDQLVLLLNCNGQLGQSTPQTHPNPNYNKGGAS
jgi:hypothetical protein